MHQNVSEMTSKHHFEAKNGQKTTKIHFLEPKMIKICSPKSKIKTSADNVCFRFSVSFRAEGALRSTAEDTRGMRKSMSDKRYIHIIYIS